jgi:hypothetical protein
MTITVMDINPFIDKERLERSQRGRDGRVPGEAWLMLDLGQQGILRGSGRRIAGGPVTGEGSARERGPVPEAQQVGHGGRQVAKAHGFADDPGRRVSSGREDEQGDMEQGPVQAVPVADQVVVIEMLAVIGGHDHHRIREEPLPFEFPEEPSELIIEVCDATVIGIAEQFR